MQLPKTNIQMELHTIKNSNWALENTKIAAKIQIEQKKENKKHGN